MSSINKELYDALIQAKVDDNLATKAAASISEEIDAGKADKTSLYQKVSNIESRIGVLEAKSAMIEKLQWVVIAGVVGLLLKSFFNN